MRHNAIIQCPNPPVVILKSGCVESDHVESMGHRTKEYPTWGRTRAVLGRPFFENIDFEVSIYAEFDADHK